MPERDKAIALIENCLKGSCEDCPFHSDNRAVDCRGGLMMKVREMLKEEAAMIEKTQKYIEIVAAMLIAAGMREGANGDHEETEG